MKRSLLLLCLLLAAGLILGLQPTPVRAHGLSMTMSAPHIHANREARITFTIAEMDSGEGQSGLMPVVQYQHEDATNPSEDSLADGDIADNGDGTYTWTKTFADVGFYSILLMVEAEGGMQARAFPLEISKPGGERIFRPSAEDARYAYQVRWKATPGHVHAGDEVTFEIELMRSFGPVNTERPWTNAFNHLTLENLRGGQVLLEDEAGNVLADLTPTGRYLGQGLYTLSHTVPEDALQPGERTTYHLHVVVTDDLGFTIDETGEEYSFGVSRHGAPAGATVSFASTVLPLFASACSACHGSTSPSAGLDLSSYSAVIASGVNGPVVIPGDAEMSRLVQALEGTLQGVAQMPLGAPPLAEDQIHGIVEAWINAGALDN